MALFRVTSLCNCEKLTDGMKWMLTKKNYREKKHFNSSVCYNVKHKVRPFHLSHDGKSHWQTFALRTCVRISKEKYFHCRCGGRLFNAITILQLSKPGNSLDLFLAITGSKYFILHFQALTNFRPFKHNLVIGTKKWRTIKGRNAN